MKTFSIQDGLAGPPSACSFAPDRIDVFAVARAGSTVWHWAGFGTNLGTTLLAPVPLTGNGSINAEGVCAVSSGPSRAEVFAVGAGTPMWWRGNDTAWATGPALPALPAGANVPPVPVAAVAASSDEIDVFAVGRDKAP